MIGSSIQLNVKPISAKLYLAMGLMAVILMMIIPLPAWILDFGLALSFGLAILIFALTLFIDRPLEFSAFPTLLLAALMLRLALNISSTKLIIGQGHTGTAAAGLVIESFANFVMGGSLFLGLVVFGILMIVNFTVITKGAGRMAEVGARFALDAMPGRQMAIDSDLASGALSHDEARLKRETEHQETNFYGSLDGASKFVKGDAIAGLLITLLNLVMGLMIGLFKHHMPVADAFATYSILTVGDGLVSQIPAVIMSLATALLLARGTSKTAAEKEIFGQLSNHPDALAAVSALMVLFAFLPGLPILPFLFGAFGLGVAAVFSHKKRKNLLPQPTESNPQKSTQNPMGDLLQLEDLHLAFASDLIPMVLDQSHGLDKRIANMRRYIAGEYGLILPKIRLTDEPALSDGAYSIRVQGVEQAKGVLKPNRMMALLPADDQAGSVSGEELAEPVYGAPAKWIDPEDQETLAIQGITIVSGSEVLATHLLEILKQNFSRLLTLPALYDLLETLKSLNDPEKAQANRTLIDNLIPSKVSMTRLLETLRGLLKEGVSIRNLPLIIESLAQADACDTPMAIAHVRKCLGFQITATLAQADPQLPMLQLDPAWEAKFQTYQTNTTSGTADVALPADLFQRLSSQLAKGLSDAANQGYQATILTSSQRRQFIKNIIQARGLNSPVISFDELGHRAKPKFIGSIAYE